jgi:uncharacterized protein (TIGR00251 family)
MILKVRVVPGSGRNSVIKQDDKFKVYLTKPAQDGRANEQLIEVLSGYLKIKKYQMKIIKGLKSRDKLVEVNE